MAVYPQMVKFTITEGHKARGAKGNVMDCPAALAFIEKLEELTIGWVPGSRVAVFGTAGVCETPAPMDGDWPTLADWTDAAKWDASSSVDWQSSFDCDEPDGCPAGAEFTYTRIAADGGAA